MNTVLRFQISNLAIVRTNNHLKEFVRWYRFRKPLWLGRAKSKMFILPPTPVIPPDDLKELKKLTDNYKTEFKSIQEFCYTEYYMKASATSESAIKKQERDKEELSQLLLENDLENERIAPMRMEFVEAEAEMRDKKLQGSVLAYIERCKIIKENAKKDLQELEVLVQSEITPDTIDDAIEKALETEVDYNFAISLDGQIHSRKKLNSL